MQHYPLRIRTCLLNSTRSTTCTRNTTAIKEKSSHSTDIQASEGKRSPLQPQLPSEVWMASQACVNKNIAQSLSKQTTTVSRTKLTRYIREVRPGLRHSDSGSIAIKPKHNILRSSTRSTPSRCAPDAVIHKGTDTRHRGSCSCGAASWA